MAIIRGQTTGVIQTPEYKSTATGDKKSGSSTYVYWAWTFEEAVAKQASLQGSGWDASISQQDNGYRIDATYNINIEQTQPGTEPENQWSMVRNVQDENLLESDRLSNITSKTKQLIELAIKNPGKGYPFVEAEKAGDADYILVAGEIYTLMLMGAKTRRMFTKTLKRTITVPAIYNTTWLNDSEGKVITTPSMIARYSIPASVAILMPNPSPSKTVLNQGDGDPNNQVIVQWGWLDMGVDRNFSSNGSVQISQEWEYGKWSTLMYDVIES